MNEFIFIFISITFTVGQPWTGPAEGYFSYRKPVLIHSNYYTQDTFVEDSTKISENGDTLIFTIYSKAQFDFFFIRDHEAFVPVKAEVHGDVKMIYK